MAAKYDSFMKEITWNLVPLLPSKNLVGYKWIYKTNFTAEEQIEKHKEWLVSKGFHKK
jgi:hypothetical protein